MKLIPKVFDAIKYRKTTDISVVGHADRAGSVVYNRQLSLQRAQRVANLLIAEGVNAKIIHVTSHGEENPLIPTADGVHEPRNRRVEITVR